MAEEKKPDASGTSDEQKKPGQADGEGSKTFSQTEMQAELDRVAAKTRAEEKEKSSKLIAEKKN
jgi:hypothetical protein